MYVDFTFYSDTYKGKVSQDDFTKLEPQAEAYLNLYTFNRIIEPDDSVKLCICELIDSVQSAAGGVVASETVGKHSISYAVEKTQEQKVRNIISKWFGASGLMYRGV